MAEFTPVQLDTIVMPIVWDITWWILVGATGGLSVRIVSMLGFPIVMKMTDRLVGSNVSGANPSGRGAFDSASKTTRPGGGFGGTGGGGGIGGRG